MGEEEQGLRRQTDWRQQGQKGSRYLGGDKLMENSL